MGAEVALAAWVPAFSAELARSGRPPGGRGAGCLWFFRRFVGSLGCFGAVLSRPFCSWSGPDESWPRFWPVWGFVPECGVARPRSAFCVCRPVRVRPLPVSLNSRNPTVQRHRRGPDTGDRRDHHTPASQTARVGSHHKRSQHRARTRTPWSRASRRTTDGRPQQPAAGQLSHSGTYVCIGTDGTRSTGPWAQPVL